MRISHDHKSGIDANISKDKRSDSNLAGVSKDPFSESAVDPQRKTLEEEEVVVGSFLSALTTLETKKIAGGPSPRRFIVTRISGRIQFSRYTSINALSFFLRRSAGALSRPLPPPPVHPHFPGSFYPCTYTLYIPLSSLIHFPKTAKSFDARGIIRNRFHSAEKSKYLSKFGYEVLLKP